MTDIILSMDSKPIEVDEVITPDNIVKITKRTRKPKAVKSAEEATPVEEVKEPESIAVEEKPKRKVKKVVKKEVVEPVVEIKQPVEEVKEEPAPVVRQKQVKKPRGRPVVDKFKVIEARIRGNEFHGADKSKLVIFISKSLGENPEYRPQMGLLLKELGHNDVMMIFSML
jgi:hypothetical protein